MRGAARVGTRIVPFTAYYSSEPATSTSSGSLVAVRAARRPFVPKECGDVCHHGKCLFQGCRDAPNCPGGMCRFEDCVSPSCEGGACIFVRCVDPTCPGGSCKFEDLQSTLTDGYCDGGSCTVNGRDWPSSFSDRLSW